MKVAKYDKCEYGKGNEWDGLYSERSDMKCEQWGWQWNMSGGEVEWWCHNVM